MASMPNSANSPIRTRIAATWASGAGSQPTTSSTTSPAGACGCAGKGVGMPSRWVTLQALRVLRWWES